MLAVVSWPACIMITAVHRHGVVVELAGRDVVGDEAADQVVAGFALLAVHQLLDVGIHRDEALAPFCSSVDLTSNPTEVLCWKSLEIFGRDAQQQRDHQ